MAKHQPRQNIVCPSSEDVVWLKADVQTIVGHNEVERRAGDVPHSALLAVNSDPE